MKKKIFFFFTLLFFCFYSNSVDFCGSQRSIARFGKQTGFVEGSMAAKNEGLLDAFSSLVMQPKLNINIEKNEVPSSQAGAKEIKRVFNFYLKQIQEAQLKIEKLNDSDFPSKKLILKALKDQEAALLWSKVKVLNSRSPKQGRLHNILSDRHNNEAGFLFEIMTAMKQKKVHGLGVQVFELKAIEARLIKGFRDKLIQDVYLFHRSQKLSREFSHGYSKRIKKLSEVFKDLEFSDSKSFEKAFMLRASKDLDEYLEYRMSSYKYFEFDVVASDTNGQLKFIECKKNINSSGKLTVSSLNKRGIAQHLKKIKLMRLLGLPDSAYEVHFMHKPTEHILSNLRRVGVVNITWDFE